MESIGFDTRFISSLVKVFPDEELTAPAYDTASALQGEVFSFQLAFKCEGHTRGMVVDVLSPLAHLIQVRRVGLAPAEYLGWNFDDNVLRTAPGLYPDPLLEIEAAHRFVPGRWHSLWITVTVPDDGQDGVPIAFKLSVNGVEHTTPTFVLNIISTRLPKQKLLHTEWFHTDCITTYYKVEAWSEAHWQLLDKYFRNAAAHGMNMLLTPLFTPPLDTQVGGERPTTQLVDVSYGDGEYRFDLSRLERWIQMAFDADIEHIEFSHLFTQWGASKTPKIIVNVDGQDEKRFGWHVDADSAEYRTFLAAFMPQLVALVDRLNLRERCIFHVSDEPGETHLESYRTAAEMLRPHLKGLKTMDALSSFDFYKNGVVENPIPSINHIEPFHEAGIPDLWTYYCTSQWKDVPNRFFHFPSARNRVTGLLLYIYDLAGFLHWGFNFWYSQYSIKPIDPYRVTDAGCGFQAGDAFLVYPGQDGPIDSLRHEVFREALQDHRALKLLERLVGRDAVVELAEDRFGRPLKMNDYPQDMDWLLSFREEINALIQKHV